MYRAYAMMYAMQLPPASDLQATWAFLQDGTNHIMTRLREGMTFAKYMQLYT